MAGPPESPGLAKWGSGVSGSSGGAELFGHVPVMGREVVELLRPVPPGLVVDGTVGGGGHARLLLEARPDLRLLGIDRDRDAVAAATAALAEFGSRVRVVHGGFEDIAQIVATESEGNVWGSCSTWV